MPYQYQSTQILMRMGEALIVISFYFYLLTVGCSTWIRRPPCVRNKVFSISAENWNGQWYSGALYSPWANLIFFIWCMYMYVAITYTNSNTGSTMHNNTYNKCSHGWNHNSFMYSVVCHQLAHKLLSHSQERTTDYRVLSLVISSGKVRHSMLGVTCKHTT